MKKNLLLLFLSASLLGGCDFNIESLKFWKPKETENSQENQGKIDENGQNQNDDQHEEEHHEEEHHEEQGGGGEEHQEEKHIHAFNNKIEESKFLASSATCLSPAKYYYSCECGEKGEETFESSNKELGEHNFEKTKVEYKDLDLVAIYEEKCSECDESKGIHFDEKMNVKRKIYIDDNVHHYIDTYNVYWSKDPIINKYFFNTFVFNNNLKQYHNDEKYVFTDIDCNDPLQLKSYEGKVKHYWYYPECHEWKFNRYISVKFDQEGRLVEYNKLDYDSEKIYQQDLITYFDNGEYSISSKEKNWNNELVLRSITNGKYDENLEIEREEIISYFEDTNPTHKEAITNDRANNKSTHVNYRQNYEKPEELVLESTLEVFFDNNHNIIKQEKTEYTIFGETKKSYKTFEYDNFGNLCKEITYCYDSTIDDYYLAESTIREFVSLDSWVHITTLNYELKENSTETVPFSKQEKYFEDGFSFDITYEISEDSWVIKNFEKKLVGEHYDLLYFESYYVSYDGAIWYPNKYITSDVRFEGKTKYWTVINYDYAPETTDGWVISEKEEYSTVVETEALYENDYTITYYEWDSELEEWIPSCKEVCYHGDDFEYYWDEETQEWILDD